MNYLIALAGLLVACSVNVPPQSLLKPEPAAHTASEIEIRVQVEAPKAPEPPKPAPKPAGLKECAEIDTGDPTETSNLKLDCLIELGKGKRK